MTHSHCKICSGLIEESFKYCRDHCPSETGYPNPLAGIVHSILVTHGVLDPPGICENCGYPSENLTFYFYRMFACTNRDCSHKKEYDSVVCYQRVLPCRLNIEMNPVCPGCKNKLVFLRDIDKHPASQLGQRSTGGQEQDVDENRTKKKLFCEVRC